MRQGWTRRQRIHTRFSRSSLYDAGSIINSITQGHLENTLGPSETLLGFKRPAHRQIKSLRSGACPKMCNLNSRSTVAVNMCTPIPFPFLTQVHFTQWIPFICRMLWTHRKTNTDRFPAAGLSCLKQYEATWPWGDYGGTVIKALWWSTLSAFLPAPLSLTLPQQQEINIHAPSSPAQSLFR